MPPGADCGVGSLREMEGLCDLCGAEAHPSAEICVAVVCTSTNCQQQIYHQGCIEKYLKGLGLDRIRKSGFPCPRGRGKGTQYPDDQCRGKVEKSHPIVPKNEQRKKKVVQVPVPASGKPPAAAAKEKKPALNGGGARKAPTPRLPNYNKAINPVPLAPSPELEEGPHVPVGMAVEQVLTKAQKRNLARRAKRALVAKADGGDSEAGTAATDGSYEVLLEDYNGEQIAVAAAQARDPADQLMGQHKFMDLAAFNARFAHLICSDSEDEAEDEDSEEEEGQSGSSSEGGSSNRSDDLGVGAAQDVGLNHVQQPYTGSSGDSSPAAAAAAAVLSAPVPAPAPMGHVPAVPGLPFLAAAAPAAMPVPAPAASYLPATAAAPAVPPFFGVHPGYYQPSAGQLQPGAGAPYAAPAPPAAAAAAAAVMPAATAAMTPSVPSFLAAQPAAAPAIYAAPYHQHGVAAPVPAYSMVPAAPAAAAGVPLMAAGHTAAEVGRGQLVPESDDDDDELNELLGLCGVST